MNAKKIITAALAAAMSIQASALAANFTDTAGLNETQLAVLDDSVNRGIITGYEDGTVRPYGTLTRAEFAAMVARYMGYDTSGVAAFSDTVGHWATGYIQACVNQGAINGMGDGTFAPESPVTFNQAAKIVSVVSGMTNGQDINALGGYPNAYITVGQNGGLFNNLTTGSTGADYNLNRIDAIVMISNAGGGNGATAGHKTIDQMTADERYEFALDLYLKTDLYRNSIGARLTQDRATMWALEDQTESAIRARDIDVDNFLNHAYEDYGDQIYSMAGYDSSKNINNMTADERYEFALDLYLKTNLYRNSIGARLTQDRATMWALEDQTESAIRARDIDVDNFLNKAYEEYGDKIYEMAGY